MHQDKKGMINCDELQIFHGYCSLYINYSDASGKIFIDILHGDVSIARKIEINDLKRKYFFTKIDLLFCNDLPSMEKFIEELSPQIEKVCRIWFTNLEKISLMKEQLATIVAKYPGIKIEIESLYLKGSRSIHLPSIASQEPLVFCNYLNKIKLHEFHFSQ